MTLARKNEDLPKWYPVSIDKLDDLLDKLIQRGHGYVNVYALRRNIAYNLQYIEFLDKCLSDLKLTEALTIQIYKNFICVGCGIIESLLEFLLVKSGHHKMTEWASICVVPSQERKVDDKVFKIDSELFQKLTSKKRVEMNFDTMIKKTEAKKLLGSDHSIYAKLQALRKLRNRVHLHLIEEPTDTDWNAFQQSYLCSMAQVLHTVFTGPLFKSSAIERGYFDYLKGQKYQPIESLPDF
jgi:hypothetical protein